MVQVTGEFDIAAVERFQEIARAPRPDLLVIDLRGASFLDSHALAAVVSVHGRAQAHGQGVAILRPTGLADRIFTLTGMDAQLPLYDEQVPVLAQMNYG